MKDALDLHDVFAVIGFAGIGAGTWMLSAAWSLIVCGTLLFAVAALGATRGARHATRETRNG